MALMLVNVDVDDIERGVRFYTTALGLQEKRRLGPGVVELLGAGAPVYLIEKAPGTPAYAGGTSRRDYQRHWTPVHLDFVVTDIAAAVLQVEAAGGRREGDIQEHAWGKMALMSDPFGHGLCLLAWNGRGYDELATG
jgi:predicted enzyme related to lactoylglutathione lyase